MLRSLSIRNFALIEDAQIDLEPGLNVWTGETGSGKSLLLSAIGLVLGSKADAGSVRAGASEAIVSCIFALHRPEIRTQVESVLGGAIDDDELIVSRRVNATTGRNSSSVNGLPVPVRVLQAIGRLLLDYVGQHQTRSLTEPETQLKLLDQFGVDPRVISQFATARQAYETARARRRQEIEAAVRDRRERELLRFELEELDRLEPVALEPARLLEEARRLARADEIRKITSETYAKLYGADSSIHDQLARMARRLAPITGLSSQLTDASEILQGLLEQVVDASSLLGEAAENAEANPKRLDAIEQRLADYRRLAARLGSSEDGLAEVRESHRKRLEEMDLRQKQISDDTELKQLWATARTAGQALGTKRTEAAKQLQAEILKPLSKLGLQSAQIEVAVAFDDWPAFVDELPIAPENPARVLMQFKPNPGEPARPLEKIASGGELSRLLLAILACMAESDQIPTVILDEIDTGVGGRLGGAVADLLKELAEHHQVICVTHLPQIAAAADSHYLVRKSKRAGRTCTTLTCLDSKAKRVEELAQMMRGTKADELTLAQAESMLTSGQKPKLDKAPGKTAKQAAVKPGQAAKRTRA